ncbi:MAG TPA: ABC transporter substrate-binding protein [Nocardioides sp.]|nr:ABC transporter substrate-binding protein [Nocardioides sp.]
MKRRTIPMAGVIAAALLTMSACGGDPLAADTGNRSDSGNGTIVVGSADFTESSLLAEIYAGALEAKGVTVKKTLNIGSREAYIPALQDGSIDLIPEYTGVLDQYFDKNASATESDAVYAELKSALPADLTVLAKSDAEDKDSVTVTRATAEKYHLTSIADLKPVAGQLTLGGPPEWKTRPTGVPGLARLYGVTFGSFRALDAGGPLSVQALKNGQVDAADLFSTDPNIPADDFVSLTDPQHLFAAQNVVPLIAKSKVTPVVSETLDKVSAALDTATLAGLLKEVVLDKKDAADVAKEFLASKGLS